MAVKGKGPSLGTQDTIWVFALVFLLSGLMFSVGLWVGYGVRPHVEISDEVASADDAEDAAGNRSPAGAAVEDERGGGKLRRRFLEDKREALAREMTARTEGTRPKSIEDANAHLAVHSEWNRAPAEARDVDEDSSRLKNAADTEKKRLKQGPPQNVKGLFERAPASIDTFDPQPGKFTVQVASFATEDEARGKVTALRVGGFDEAYFKSVKIRGGETWYRVFVGSYPSPVWAKKMGEKLKRQRMTTDYAIREVN